VLSTLPGSKLVVAMDVDRLQIALQICSPIGWADDMVQLQTIAIPKCEPTAGAASPLALEQTSHWCVCRPVPAETFTPVDEVAVVG
jgi:hypothetical protein